MAFLNRYILFMLFTGLFFGLSFTSPYKKLNIDFLLDNKNQISNNKESISKKTSNKRAFINVIKDYQKIEGLFTIYWNKDNNNAFIAILPEQFEKIFLAGITRQSGDAYYLDGSSMLNEYPDSLEKLYKIISLSGIL